MTRTPPVKFHWRGNHHSYHGIWIIAFGLFQIYMGMNNLEELFPLWYLLIGVGAFMLVDDIIEHAWTADTPLRILWEKIYKVIKD